MAVESIDRKGGPPKARVICDGCSKEEIVPCPYESTGAGNVKKPVVSNARGKVIAMGWTYVKSTLRCPECEAKRKVVPMQKPQNAQPDRQMTKKEKVSIYAMLSEVYDIDQGRYMQGDTDETVAEVLKVLPGWVAEIREADFGPDGTNEDIDALITRLDDMEQNLCGIEGDCKNILADCQAFKEAAATAMRSNQKKMEEVAQLRADLEKIRKAVGPRVLKKAGV